MRTISRNIMKSQNPLLNFQGKDVWRNLMGVGTTIDGRKIRKNDILEIYKNTRSYIFDNPDADVSFIPVRIGSHTASDKLNGYIKALQLREEKDNPSLWVLMFLRDNIAAEYEEGAWPSLSPGLRDEGYTREGKPFGKFLEHVALLGETRAAQGWLSIEGIQNLYSSLLEQVNHFSTMVNNFVAGNTKGDTTMKIEVDKNTLLDMKEKLMGVAKSIGECVGTLEKASGKELSEKEKENLATEEDKKSKKMAAEGEEKETKDITIEEVVRKKEENGEELTAEEKEYMVKKYSAGMDYGSDKKKDDNYNASGNTLTFALEDTERHNMFNALIGQGKAAADQKDNFFTIAKNLGNKQAFEMFQNFQVPNPYSGQEKTGNLYSTESYNPSQKTGFSSILMPDKSEEMYNHIQKNGFGK